MTGGLALLLGACDHIRVAACSGTQLLNPWLGDGKEEDKGLGSHENPPLRVSTMS